MAKKVINIIYNLVRRRLAQSGAFNRGPGITSLPDTEAVESGMQQIFKQLKEGGYNVVSADKVIKNEEDLLRVIEEINQKKIRDNEARQKFDAGITRVFDKMRRGIPLNPDDQAALQGSGFKTALDNFKGFEPKVIQGGRDLTMKTPGGEIPYIESPTQTIIQGGKKVPVKIPKGTKDDLLASYDNVMIRGEDTKYDADVLATDLAERRGFIKEGQDATDMDQKDYSKLYSEAYSFLTKSRFLNRPPRKPKKAKGGLIKALDKLKKKFGKDIIRKGEAPKDKNDRKKIRKMIKEFEERNERALEDFVDDAGGTKEGVEFDVEPFDGADGGLAYMLGEPREKMAAGGPALRRLLQFLHQGADKPMKGSEGLKKMKLPKQVKFFAQKQGFDPDQIRINYLEQVLESLKADKKMMKGLEPDVPSQITGKAKSESELIADDIFKKQFLNTTQGGRFKDLTPDMIDSSIMELEGILKNLKTKGRKLNADGGRIGLKDGGMSRRTFLKIMAALASFPVVGKLAKTTKLAKGVAPIVTPTAEMPAHFPKLVEKILKEGQVVKKDFVKKTGDVTTYRHPDRPDIELTVEGEGNRIQLDFETDQGMKAGYEFRKGDIIDDPASPMRGKRGPNEFNQGEVKYKGDSEGNYYKDFEEGIDTGTENLDDFAGVGKQKTSKSKVILNDEGGPIIRIDEDLADGGLAGLLGE